MRAALDRAAVRHGERVARGARERHAGRFATADGAAVRQAAERMDAVIDAVRAALDGAAVFQRRSSGIRSAIERHAASATALDGAGIVQASDEVGRDAGRIADDRAAAGDRAVGRIAQGRDITATG